MDVVKNAMIYFSLFLIVTGTIGGVFLKNYYVRLHFVGISDTIGGATLLLTLAFFSQHHIIYLLLGILILVQGPAITHILARGAVKAKINVEEKRWHSPKR